MNILNMKNKLIILSLIFTIFATSCASRKTDRKEQKQKIDFTEQLTEEVKTNTETTTKVVDTSTIDEIEIVPIDSTKPIEYNGHKVINGTLKLSKRKNNITTDKVEKVAKNESKAVKTELKVNTQVREKETERKSGFNWWWLLFLIIPIAYLKYKKYI
jgi:PBP1b-binding outer membrane lipoprotein LpoB